MAYLNIALAPEASGKMMSEMLKALVANNFQKVKYPEKGIFPYMVNSLILTELIQDHCSKKN